MGPLRISYVTFARLPTGRAHGYAIMKMCEQFASGGHSVELVVPTRRHGLKEDPFSYYGIERNFTMHKLWATDFLGRFENSRVSFFVDQFTFLLSLWTRSFGVVYTRDYQIALFVRSKSIALEIHDIPKKTYLFKKALSRAQQIVVISYGLMRELIELGVPEKKIIVSPDAVDMDEFRVAPDRTLWEKFGVDSSKKIALYTGAFYGWKGADTFALSAQNLSKNIEVVLMGGIDQELKDFREKYSGDHVHIISYQHRDVLAQLLKSADVLILPNSKRDKISSHYTSPLKLFQYMASGVPIVASDVPSIKEVLTIETCYWFAADDERSLSVQIEYVLTHPEEAAVKAGRAREEVKKYTWGARARSIIESLRLMRPI